MAQPERGAGAQPTLIAQIASRQGAVVVASLVLLSGLAWLWLWRSAAAPMGGIAPDTSGMANMSDMAGMPGMTNMNMTPPAVAWTPGYLVGAFLMWAIMMVAMMLPSAAPMILLHEAFARRNGLGGAATAAFAASYLAVWTAFALLAAVAQSALVGARVVERASLAIGDARLSSALLVAAALYELSPFKRYCLSQCQSPATFLTRHWRPGVSGAVAMGLRHGAFCIGCCAVLMLLLFVGGVMNLAWIAALAALVLAEKYAPPAWRADRILAALLLVAAIGVLAL
jgi:predicted metal-binding membrane protein